MLSGKDTHFPTKRGGHVPFRIFLSGFPAGKLIRISKVLVFWLWPHLQVPKTGIGTNRSWKVDKRLALSFFKEGALMRKSLYIYIYFLVVLRQGSSCSSWYIHFFISRFKVVRKLVLSSRRSRSEASQAEVFEELLGLKHVEPIVGGVIRWWVPPDSLGGWVQWNGAGNIIL